MLLTHGVKSAFIHGIKRDVDKMVLGFVVLEYVSSECKDMDEAKEDLELKTMKISGALIGKGLEGSKMEKKFLTFALSPEQMKYKKILSKDFLELDVWAISDIDPNRNRTHFTFASMQEALPTFKNKPILGYF